MISVAKIKLKLKKNGFCILENFYSNKKCDLIKTFKKYSGIGAVLNTSLNIHEKPIIMDPIDIVQDFIITKKILIDNIYVHDTLFTLKKKYQVNKI